MPRKLTLDEFLLRCKEKHGDLYDYSCVDKYEGYFTKMTIICHVHGRFEQGAGLHMAGSHCQECAKATIANHQRSSTETFILKARKVHGDKYTYDATVYSGVDTTVIISCSLHGHFEQTARVHLAGCGCQKCGLSENGQVSYASRQKLSQEEVIRRIQAVHGDRYDVSQIDYKSVKEKIKLAMQPLMESSQSCRAMCITKGQGCHACGKLATSLSMRATQEDVIKRFQNAHGGLYDYSQVVYTGNIDKVKIICSVHGPFWQRANTPHGWAWLRLPVATVYRTQPKPSPSELLSFTATSSDTKGWCTGTTRLGLVITCPEHGDFEQLPMSHLAGKGCWKCRTRAYSKQQIAWLEWRSVRDGVYIQHALNEGEHIIANSSYRADGYSRASHTVFEYAGLLAWEPSHPVKSSYPSNP